MDLTSHVKECPLNLIAFYYYRNFLIECLLQNSFQISTYLVLKHVIATVILAYNKALNDRYTNQSRKYDSFPKSILAVKQESNHHKGNGFL